MNEILHRLIMDHKGPWKDYSTDTRKQYRDICEAVAGQIIQSITGIHPDGCDGISAEYDFFFFNEEIFVYLTFQDRATCWRVCQREGVGSLLNGFAAIGRAIQPAIEAFRVFALHCNANRKARRAIARGNVAKWNWYTREHLRRHSEAINSGSQDR